MRILVNEIRYATSVRPFLDSLTPYDHQWQTRELVRQAIAQGETICLENTSVTGSGKTLANFSTALLDGYRTCGIYPTNELLVDQARSLDSYIERYLQPHDKIIIADSMGLDWQQTRLPHLKSHVQTLEFLSGTDLPTLLLTNPDILHLVTMSLYGQMESTFHRPSGSRVFQNFFNNYPVFAFDEFHLYNPKQIATVAMIIGLAKTLFPTKPHVFIFSSATPQSLFHPYAQRLNIPVIPVQSKPSANGRIVCEQIELTIHAANLLAWRGSDAMLEKLDEICLWADEKEPQARGVFLVDGVYEARRIVEHLRERFPLEKIGEVHGFMDATTRADGLLQRLTVGTTTIDVGVDFVGAKAKHFLVAEARSAAQAIQRLGRLGRQGRDSSSMDRSNRAWLFVPEYVAEYISNRLSGQQIATLKREELNQLLHEAFIQTENFQCYTTFYSPLEAVAASERIAKQYQNDHQPDLKERLHGLISTMFPHHKHIDPNEAYQSYLKRQYAIWQKYGATSTTSPATSVIPYLGDLESFRGGFESELTVAVYDDTDWQRGFKPLKYYHLFFVLRRTQCEELSKQDFEKLIEARHPEQAETWLQEIHQHHRLFGYLHVHDLLHGKPRQVRFEARRSQLGYQTEHVVRLTGLDIDAEGLQLRTKHGIRATLRAQSLNTWFSEHPVLPLTRSLRLPPLFQLYPLSVRRPNGRTDEWSIALGIDAFLLESVTRTRRRYTPKSQNDDEAIFC